MEHYFERTGAHSYRATRHTTGAWRTSEQHIAPALGLLVHAVECDREERAGDKVIGRLSFDILGTVAVEEVETSVRVIRPGRTIELVEATLAHAGRPAVTLRAWLMQAGETGELAGDHHAPMPSVEQTPVWDMSTVWPGGFIASAEVRRAQDAPGRARAWVRSDVALVDDDDVSPLAHAARLLDIANGIAVRVSPQEVAFPNLDLTAHLFRQPRGEWLGFDTSVSFGPGGTGVTSTVLHDESGAVGTMDQILTVRP